jgi:hypothetical protein
MYYFYARRSRKRKKIQLVISIFLRLRDLRAQKLYVKRWWNWALMSISTTFMHNCYAFRSQKRKEDWQFQCHISLLGSAHMKAVRRMLMKLSPAFLLSPGGRIFWKSKLILTLHCLKIKIKWCQLNFRSNYKLKYRNDILDDNFKLNCWISYCSSSYTIL